MREPLFHFQDVERELVTERGDRAQRGLLRTLRERYEVKVRLPDPQRTSR